MPINQVQMLGPRQEQREQSGVAELAMDVASVEADDPLPTTAPGKVPGAPVPAAGAKPAANAWFSCLLRVSGRAAVLFAFAATVIM